MDPALTSFLTIAGSGIAAYYGAYFKKRGEDQAMKEGFAEVLRQTAETTRTTKAIEAKITDEVWDRQKRWELKRDILLQALKRITAVDDTLTNLKSFMELDANRLPQGGELDSQWEQRKLDMIQGWHRACTDLDETCGIVDAICSFELKVPFDDLSKYTKFVASHLSRGALQRWAELQMEMWNRMKRARTSIRKELELNVTKSQSNVSSAAPTPVPPNPEVK
jgi:hypothetical protein